jgi:predicted ATP-dependent endonuclease of OLD family
LPTPRIKIKELDPFTGSTFTYSLQDSASGYNELLHLLLQKTQAEDTVLILDEPALHLHPTKIRHLSRRLIGSSRQIILITHSPFFVDVSNIGLGNGLIYIKRDDRSSSVSSKTNNQSVEIKSYIFDPNVFFSKFNILVEGSGDAASFFAISDSLESVFEKYNIIVINAGGDGNIDAYIKLMESYQIPYVAMVDNQYMGINTASDKFVRLNSKLEYELKDAGWQGSVEGSIDPNAAYEFVYNTIQTGNAKKIRSTLIGVIFDRALTSVGVVPDDLWNPK